MDQTHRYRLEKPPRVAHHDTTSRLVVQPSPQSWRVLKQKQQMVCPLGRVAELADAPDLKSGAG